jgi:hypothetical protein
MKQNEYQKPGTDEARPWAVFVAPVKKTVCLAEKYWGPLHRIAADCTRLQ